MYCSQFTKATNKSKTFFWKTEQKTCFNSEITLPDGNPGVKTCCYISHLQPSPLQRRKCLVQCSWAPRSSNSCHPHDQQRPCVLGHLETLLEGGKQVWELNDDFIDPLWYWENLLKTRKGQQDPYKHPMSKSLNADGAFSNTPGCPQDNVYGPSFSLSWWWSGIQQLPWPKMRLQVSWDLPFAELRSKYLGLQAKTFQ